jgi:hypothetical protein
MITASLSDYFPLADLLKILAVCLVVAVAAPSAVSIAIVGLDRRSHANGLSSNDGSALALIVLGVAILVALVGLGLYTLFEH